MNFSKINEPSNKKTILVAPLDWGLGHAARCIPLIRALLLENVEVLIAASGATKFLLQQEFPSLRYIPLEGYNIYYGRSAMGLFTKMMLQVPKILFRIYQEHQWLKKAIAEYSINAIISDNRFGLYHPSLPCVYITHQLTIKTGHHFSEKILQRFHYWFIKKYSECWIPDNSGAINAGGQLSHPAAMPPNAFYIGCISRLEKKKHVQKIYDLLIILSGPEPQRTIFEEMLMEQLKKYSGSVMFIRGLPGSEKIDSKFQSPKNVLYKNHCTAPEINMAMAQSTMLVCRSGYTTVMDLIKLGQKAILIPTPGQTEQEYLAAYLHQQKIFYSMPQQNFSLKLALEQTNNFSFFIPQINMELHKEKVKQFVQSL